MRTIRNHSSIDINSINKKNIKAIFFDLDGTLYNDKLFKLLYLFTHPISFTKAHKLGQVRNLVRGQQTFNQSNYDQIDKHFCSKTRKEIQNIIWPKTLSNIGPFAKVQEVLAYYKERNTFLCVISDDAPKEKLRSLGILKYFDEYIDLNDYGSLKPSKNFLENYLKDKNLNISDCLFVGDKIKLDKKLALKLGMDFLYKPSFRKWNKVISTIT